MKLFKHLMLAAAAAGAIQLSARTIYITRHAQAGSVIKEIKETKITEDLGIIQAQKLANYLVNKIKFNGPVYSSPFYRTTETAIYTAKLLNTKAILDPGLQELATHAKPSPPGLTLAQQKSYFGNMITPGKRYKDGWRLCKETTEMRRIRVAKALDAILAETRGDILLVTHGAGVGDLNRILKSRAINKEVKKLKGSAWNCALYIYELNEKGQVVSGRYTTEYLSDMELTNNFRSPKIERPADKRYMTRAQDAADRAKRNAQTKSVKKK